MVLKGHSDRAWAIAWNPVRPLLASCSADKSVRLYGYREQEVHENPPTLKFSFNSVIDTGHAKAVRTLAWSPSGNTLATGSFDSNVAIWQQTDAEEDGNENGGDWECASTLEGHETECKGLAYSASGTLLASCSRDKSVWVWEGTLLVFKLFKENSLIDTLCSLAGHGI
jgi:cytosolic iron-sulfur protein assembly protein CIAO1